MMPSFLFTSVFSLEFPLRNLNRLQREKRKLVPARFHTQALMLLAAMRSG
jgi:hypothetical protein